MDPEEQQNGSAGEAGQVAEEEVQERRQLDPELEARRRAALSLVRVFGDPALRSRAAEVSRFDDDLATEVSRMSRIMDDAMGVGLAATQLGVMHRLLVYRTGPGAPLVAVVNPRVEWQSDERETAEEGCLSLPGVVLDVERSIHLRIGAADQHGEEITIEASGLDARVLQHEMDHLDGVLILDRVSREDRREALRILREGPDAASPDSRASAEVEPTESSASGSAV
jgi:peptide deformylase